MKLHNDGALIVGAGGLAREIACLYGLAFVSGFFVDQKYDVALPDPYPKVLGPIEAVADFPGRIFVAIGDPEGRAEVVDRLMKWGISRDRFVSFFHTSTLIAPTAKIGIGCLIGPHCWLSADAKLGDFCVINGHAGVGHGAKVGNFCTLSSHVDLTGGVGLGDRVFMGSRSGALPGVQIGDDSVIGAGAIAVRNVPPMATIYEQPPRFLRPDPVIPQPKPSR